MGDQDPIVVLLSPEDWVTAVSSFKSITPAGVWNLIAEYRNGPNGESEVFINGNIIFRECVDM